MLEYGLSSSNVSFDQRREIGVLVARFRRMLNRSPDDNSVPETGAEKLAPSGVDVTAIDAKIVDISVDGLSIETTRSLRVGLQIPLSIGWRRRAMPLQGEVVWCSLVGTWRNELSDVLPVYRAGVRFEWEEEERVTDLCKFLEENALITLDRKIYGRWRVT